MTGTACWSASFSASCTSCVLSAKTTAAGGGGRGGAPSPPRRLRPPQTAGGRGPEPRGAGWGGGFGGGGGGEAGAPGWRPRRGRAVRAPPKPWSTGRRNAGPGLGGRLRGWGAERSQAAGGRGRQGRSSVFSRGNWKEYHRPCRPTVWVSRLASGCQRGWTALLNSSRDSDPFLSASICAKLLLTAGRASASFFLSLPSRVVSARSNAAFTSFGPADDGVGAALPPGARAPPAPKEGRAGGAAGGEVCAPAATPPPGK